MGFGPPERTRIGEKQWAGQTYLYPTLAACQTPGFCSPLDLLSTTTKARPVSKTRFPPAPLLGGLRRHVPVPFCVSLRSRRCVDRGPSRGQGRNASHWDLGARTCASAGGRRSNPCGRERVPASSGQPYAHPEESRAAVAPAVGGDRASACWGGWSGSDGRDRVRLSTCIARRAPCRQVGRPPGLRM